jgi:hypothetical protein
MTQHSNSGKLALTAAGLATAAVLLSQIKFEEKYEEDITENFGMIQPLRPRGVPSIQAANGQVQNLNANPLGGPTFATVSVGGNGGRKLTGSLPDSAFISNANYQPTNTSMSTNMRGNVVGSGGVRLNVLNSAGTPSNKQLNMPGLATRADVGLKKQAMIGRSAARSSPRVNRSAASSCGGCASSCPSTQLNNVLPQQPVAVSNEVPAGQWDIQNEAGINTFNVAQNLVYSTARNRLQALADPIRGDIAIVPQGQMCATSAQFDPSQSLQAGALAVMGGINNVSNQDTINLLAANSGGTNITQGGVNVPQELASAAVSPPSQLSSQSFLGAPGAVQQANQMLNTSQVTQKQLGSNAPRGEVVANTGFASSWSSFP